jgi:Prokaryotic RING finger family 1
MHFSFGLLFVLFLLLRAIVRWGVRGARKYDLFGAAQRAFSDLVAQNGGNSYTAAWRKLIYVTQDRSAEIQYRSDSRRIVIRLRKSFPHRLSFYHIPRLPFAFLDAFLDPRMKLDGTYYLTGSRDPHILASLKEKNGFVPLMQKLDQAGFSVQLGEYGMKLWKRARVEDLNDVTLMSYIRLAQDLSHLGDPELIPIPMQPLSSEKHCAYCKELLSELDSVLYCQSCGTPHHKECFELNGRCTVYGCERPVPQPELLLNDGSAVHQ